MRLPKFAVSAAAISVLPGCLLLEPLEDARFQSCDAARKAVQAAGRDGLQFAHERAYDDATCYIGNPNYHTVFPVVRRIGGQQCTVGNVCIEFSSAAGAG